MMTFLRIKALIGLLLCIAVRCLSSYNSHVFTPKMTWTNARKSCQGRGYDLLQVKSVERFSRLQHLLGNPHHDVTYWIGARETRQRWIWAHDRRDLMEETMGCYDNDDLENHVYTNFTNNHPALCSGFCLSMMQRQYSGLQDRRCYCFYDIESLGFKDISLCSNPCPGNSFQKCGGSNEINVYHNWGIVSWGLNEPSELGSGRDCAYIISSPGGDIKWYSDDCSQRHMFVCKINSISVCSWINKTSPCYYVMKEHITWFEARKRCYWTGGYLADADIEQLQDTKLQEGVYWAGLSRIGQAWVDRTMVDLPYVSQRDNVSTNDMSCLSITHKEHQSSWTLETTSCSQAFGFVCDTNAPGPINLNKNTTSDVDENKELHQQFFYQHMKMLVAISSTCGVILLLASYVIYRKRKQQRSIELKRRRHFYYILEKLNPVYGRIIPTSIQHSDTSPPGIYNNLVFKGTMKHAKRKGEEIVLEEYATRKGNLQDENSPGYDRINNDSVNSVMVSSMIEIHDIYDEVNIKY